MGASELEMSVTGKLSNCTTAVMQLDNYYLSSSSVTKKKLQSNFYYA